MVIYHIGKLLCYFFLEYSGVLGFTGFLGLTGFLGFTDSAGVVFITFPDSIRANGGTSLKKKKSKLYASHLDLLAPAQVKILPEIHLKGPVNRYLQRIPTTIMTASWTRTKTTTSTTRCKST